MHRYMVNSIAALLCILVTAARAYTEEDHLAATVTFSGCTEFAGEGPIALAGAQGLVPSSYIITGANNGLAQIVVRATSCQGLRVDGSAHGPAIVAHVGINIESPDGTGDINNYTVIYATSSLSLARSLQRLGLPALYNSALAYEFTPNSDGSSGTLYAEVSGDRLAPYFLYGTETNPSGGGAPFLANWWYNGCRGIIKMSTDFPDIAFGTALETLYTSKVSLLGKLIGGNTYSNFSILALHGVYSNAQMTVTLTR
ncbi:MAG: hypothetical protein JO189_17960 [Deltaproteobacteria bacterium]|nr:hypothetical protein [Deltaproteobacteria bacterium]